MARSAALAVALLAVFGSVCGIVRADDAVVSEAGQKSGFELFLIDLVLYSYPAALQLSDNIHSTVSGSRVSQQKLFLCRGFSIAS
jgi:hypothetical protein